MLGRYRKGESFVLLKRPGNTPRENLGKKQPYILVVLVAQMACERCKL